MIYEIQKLKFTFWAEDGSSVSSIVFGEALDMGDKAGNKCMSIALKYALLQTFMIPTEDMQDPDSVSPQVNNSAPAQAAVQKPAQKEPTKPKENPEIEVLKGNYTGEESQKKWLLFMFQTMGLNDAPVMRQLAGEVMQMPLKNIAAHVQPKIEAYLAAKAK
jgi:hypothetical protein